MHGIEGELVPQPIGVAAQVRRAHAPIGADLLLHRKVPRLDAVRIDVGIHRTERAKLNVRRIRPGHDRMRIAAPEPYTADDNDR